MRIILGTLAVISMLGFSSLSVSAPGRTPGANCSLPNVATGQVYYSLMYAGSYVRSKQVATQNVMYQCQSAAGANAAQVCLPENVSCSIAYRV